jgi:membrane carboxypeptidase/penicillin-binding protein PbpC
MKVKKLASAVLTGLLAALALYFYLDIKEAKGFTQQILIPMHQTAAFELRASQLTPRQLDILLKVEDPDFFRHGGIDLVTPGAGLTTITQSLVKIHYFNDFKPGLRKLRQSLIAYFVLDPLVSKDDLLTWFINQIGLGQGVKASPRPPGIITTSPSPG